MALVYQKTFLTNFLNVTTRGTSNEKGTGLGLMVCKDFMNRNGGNITVETEEGKGSKFCISIPTTK
jgi:signal transduction histidine kinase